MEASSNLDYLSKWRQGDYFANESRSDSTIWSRIGKRILARSEGTDSSTLVVLSQTCDLQPLKEPDHVTVAPQVDLMDKVASLDRARRGEYPRYVHLPRAGDTAFADLALMTSIPIDELRNVDSSRGVKPGKEQREFAHGVGRWFSRFPFPDDFTVSMKRLVDKVKSKHDKPESYEGRAFNRLKQVRVRANPDWEADRISISLIFIVGDDELPPLGEEDTETELWASKRDSATIAERLLSETDPRIRGPLWWRLGELWLDACKPSGTIDSIDADLETWANFSLADVATSERLDLDYLSGPVLIGD